MLSYLVPLIVILILTFLTDVYTFIFNNYYNSSSKQCSPFHVENHSLNDICRICQTHCQYQCTVIQKVDIPLKSTAISCILLVITCFSLMSINNNPYLMFNILIFVWLFFTAVNIPMIVCLSTRNNFANIAAARQRNNSLAWNRTNNQQWEIKCAREDRIQNIL